MNNAMQWDREDGVLNEWAGWFRAVPPLLPVAIGCAIALLGSVLTFSNVDPSISGILALAVMIFLGWGANLGIREWIRKRESLATTFLLLDSVAFIQAYNAYLVLPASWPTMKLLGWVFAVIPLAGAILIVLPMVVRKIVLLLFLGIHFTGILCAVTAVDPPGQAAPWIPSYLWGKFYRPYLQFLYMNNAYHFYSPEPGPAVLLWFKIEYDNEKSRWYKIPNLDDGKVSLLFFRQLSLTELGTNQSLPYLPGNINDIVHMRNVEGLNMHPKIPALPYDLAQHSMYRQPVPKAIDNMESYCRHVAKKFPHPDDNSEAKITRIRIYRVTHLIVHQAQLAKGKDPKDPWTYLPYFYGDYGPDGKMLNSMDPFLWFSLPIYDPRDSASRPANFESEFALDYFKLHSGLDLYKEKP